MILEVRETFNATTPPMLVLQASSSVVPLQIDNPTHVYAVPVLFKASLLL